MDDEGRTQAHQLCDVRTPLLTVGSIHQLNPAGLLVNLQRQYNPTGLPVRPQALSGIHPQSHWSPCAFTGIHLQSHWAPCSFTGMYPHTNPQSTCPPHPFSPIPGSMFYTTYVTRDSRTQRVCSPGAGFNPPEFVSPCGLPVSCCFATSVVRSRNFNDWLPLRVSMRASAWTRRGPRGLPSHKIFMVLGGMKTAFVPSPSPGPWRARRLDSMVWTLVFGWPQLGLILPLRCPSWSRYILGSGVELN